MLYLHVLFATLLAALFASLTPLYWLIGFAGFYPVCKLVGLMHAASRLYAMRIEAGLVFVPWFTWQVLRASADVARVILLPGYQVEPAVVCVPLHTQDKRLVTLIGCLLTLTPGTLALDYRPRSGGMFVHVLDTRSVESVTAAISEIERRLMRWVQPNGGGQ